MENFRLRVFRAVARYLNFRVAAEELLLTQPAVTQQIKAHESSRTTGLYVRRNDEVSLDEVERIAIERPKGCRKMV